MEQTLPGINLFGKTLTAKDLKPVLETVLQMAVNFGNCVKTFKARMLARLCEEMDAKQTYFSVNQDGSLREIF
jgi:hypothetical protein